jgi:hypothetical protein
MEVLASNHLGVYLGEQINLGALTNVNVQRVIVTTKDFEALRAYSVEYEWTQRPLRPRL